MKFRDEQGGFSGPADAGSSALGGWSDQQLMRLDQESRRLQRTFAYHPHVRIIPLHGEPPDQYQVEYRLRTLVMPEGGALEYTASSAVHVWLPPGFPNEPPLVRPISALFHPNVAPDGIKIDHLWQTPNSSLVQVVSGVGELLAFQYHELNFAANETAMDWVVSNPQHAPVDPAANLGAEAGGDPLARICRFGPRTLEQIRAQLKGMVDSLVSAEGAPTPLELKMFAQRTRQALGIFIEEDVPQDLRAPAAELDEWARQMPDSMGVWEVLRRYRSAAGEAFAVAGRLKDSEKALTHEIVAIDSLAGGEVPQTPAKAMRMIPPGAKIQMHLGNLVNLIGRAEGAVNEARTASGKLAALPQLTPKKTTGALGKRIEAEVNRAAAHAGEANEKLNNAYSFHDPVLGRARVHATALKRANDWREYADMVDRAEELAGKIISWGPAGMQAYFIENASGTFGPFELEQKLTMGSSGLAVRNPASSIIEILDADSGVVIKKAADGSIVKKITDPQSGEKFPSTFRLTGNCDELAVQLDYLERESSLMLRDLVSKVRPPEGWLGRALDMLAINVGKVQHEHEEKRRHWAMLRDDLAAMRPFKERIATVRMLQRTAELAPMLVARMAEAKNSLQAATDRVAVIVTSCDRDIETERLLIPSRFAREYPQQLHKRDSARALIEQLQKHFRVVACDVSKRVDDPQLKGLAKRPVLKALGEIPQAWLEMEGELGDAAIEQKLRELEGMLGVSFNSAQGAVPKEEAGELEELEIEEEEDDVVDLGFEPKE